jgi:hypothetical protein
MKSSIELVQAVMMKDVWAVVLVDNLYGVRLETRINAPASVGCILSASYGWDPQGFINSR